MPSQKKDLSIVLSGEAGQGLKTLEVIFSKIVKASGYHVFTYTEFMSRIRGGNNTTEIRVSSTPCHSFVDRIDVAIPLQKDALKRLAGRITPETLIIGEMELIDAEYRAGGYSVFEVPFHSITREIGGGIFLNTLVTGLLTALLGIEEASGLAVMRKNLKKGDAGRMKKNEAAFTAGYGEGKKICSGGKCPFSFTVDPLVKNDVLLYGSDSIGIGALAGGCNFIAAYPMSPSTAILEFMAKQAAAFGVVAEQAEDEIAAVNMALGSWYAGGRALVSTSGGGFALMEEGISCAGCIESPLVVHIGQRPGPATGLPTRTEQGDLNLALYAGHGEFPRVIYAPANFQDGVELTCKAFNCSDEYQIPVFVLTDQYFLESSYNTGAIRIEDFREKKHLIETTAGYKRYASAENGVSPRGIPGHGGGIVCADSDEHDEGGYITEDFGVRAAMVDKRNKKLEALGREAVAPRFIGPRAYKHLLVGWGSTFNALGEALELSGRRDLALLHFSQVYPVPLDAVEWLKKAERRIIVENNSTAQFGALLERETGLAFHKKILKYNGMPFSVEDICNEIKAL